MLNAKAKKEIMDEVEALRLTMGVKEPAMAGILLSLSASYAMASGIQDFQFVNLSRETYNKQR